MTKYDRDFLSRNIGTFHVFAPPALGLRYRTGPPTYGLSANFLVRDVRSKVPPESAQIPDIYDRLVSEIKGPVATMWRCYNDQI